MAALQGDVLNKTQAVMVLMTVLSLVAAAIAVAKPDGRVDWRTRFELALLKAIGATDGAVSRFMLAETAVISGWLVRLSVRCLARALHRSGHVVFGFRHHHASDGVPCWFSCCWRSLCSWPRFVDSGDSGLASGGGPGMVGELCFIFVGGAMTNRKMFFTMLWGAVFRRRSCAMMAVIASPPMPRPRRNFKFLASVQNRRQAQQMNEKQRVRREPGRHARRKGIDKTAIRRQQQ